MPASFNALYPPLSYFMATILRCSLILFDQSQIFFWAQQWTQDKRVQDKRVMCNGTVHNTSDNNCKKIVSLS